MRFERRVAPRRRPSECEPVSQMRVRAGRELLVLDLSSAGALVQGEARLLPGTHVDVHVMTVEGRALVRSRVTRVWVSHLSADRVEYRSAIAFDRSVRVADGYPIPEGGTENVDAVGTLYPADAAAAGNPDRLSRKHAAF
jgi:hypothetical protein